MTDTVGKMSKVEAGWYNVEGKGMICWESKGGFGRCSKRGWYFHPVSGDSLGPWPTLTKAVDALRRMGIVV